MENGIIVNNLTKAFHNRRLFAGLNLTIKERSVLVVLGPNGSGKTTFLRIICGLIPATSGRADFILGGKPLALPEKRAQLGLVSPDLELYGDLSAVENMEFFSRVRGLPFTMEKARTLLEFAGLKGRGWDHVRNYSSGMKQRLKYACALLHDPYFLLLDEPTSCLDEQGAAMVDTLIRRHREKGIVIMATNEPREESYADQTLSLA